MKYWRACLAFVPLEEVSWSETSEARFHLPPHCPLRRVRDGTKAARVQLVESNVPSVPACSAVPTARMRAVEQVMNIAPPSASTRRDATERVTPKGRR